MRYMDYEPPEPDFYWTCSMCNGGNRAFAEDDICEWCGMSWLEHWKSIEADVLADEWWEVNYDAGELDIPF